MRSDVESLPIVGRAYQLGVNPVTTTLVLLGPVAIGVIAITGRSSVTVVLGIVYVLSLPASMLYFWATTSEESESEDESDDGNNENEESSEEENQDG